MENNVEISIIVPIYNQEKYLKKCLDSIQSQTFSNFEVILVNDGSIDGSEEIALKYVASDSRFKYFKNENHGLSYSRNFGIQHSQGNYICFIDSDDYIDNKFLDILYNGIKKGYSICKCGFEKVYDSNYNSEEHKCIKYYEVSKEIVIKQLIDPYNPDFNDFAWNKIYDRHLFDLILFKDGACFEDTEIMYKLILASKNVSITDEKLYFYRQNESGIVHNIDFEGINDYMMFVNERYLVLKNIIDKESLDSAIRNSYFFCVKTIY